MYECLQAQTNRCVINMEGKFAHALWMSSRAASTLGFDTIRPNPECPLTNLTVMLQARSRRQPGFLGAQLLSHVDRSAA